MEEIKPSILSLFKPRLDEELKKELEQTREVMGQAENNKKIQNFNEGAGSLILSKNSQVGLGQISQLSKSSSSLAQDSQAGMASAD